MDDEGSRDHGKWRQLDLELLTDQEPRVGHHFSVQVFFPIVATGGGGVVVCDGFGEERRRIGFASEVG